MTTLSRNTTDRTQFKYLVLSPQHGWRCPDISLKTLGFVATNEAEHCLEESSNFQCLHSYKYWNIVLNRGHWFASTTAILSTT